MEQENEPKEKPEKKSTNMTDYEERKNNAQPRYLTEGKKQYLLASSQESYQALLDNQLDELTRVLIDLKSEHDRLTLDTKRTEAMIKEYDIRIKMLQGADEKNDKVAQERRDLKEGMIEDISAKKNRKEEEKFNQKTLNKQVERLNRDIFILQKQIVKYENESEMLDKKTERAQINSNIINEKKNKVHSKITDQQGKNAVNKDENKMKISQYKKIIKLKSDFLKFSDERKKIQNDIAQQAKNDNQDKEEKEKRKTLKLLTLYNQYLRKTMDDQLKENETLENVFEQIRDICGTQDLQTLVDFIVLRSKRYNYECEEIKKREDKKVELKEELITLKEELTNLRNQLVVKEEDESGKDVESTVPSSTKEEDEVDLLKKEQENEEKLKELGQKFNEIDTAYVVTLQNLNSMVDFENKHPLDVKIDEEEEENEEEEEKKEEQKNENEEENRQDEENPEQRDENAEENRQEENKQEENKQEEKKPEENTPEENKPEENKPEGENVEENIQDAEKKVEEKNENEDNEEEEDIELTEEEQTVIKNYQLLLKKVMKTFDILYLCHNKQEFLNLMKEKGKLKESEVEKTSQTKTRRKNLRLGTKSSLGKSYDRRYVKTESYRIVAQNVNEEDDRSNYDPDKKILRRFMNEQKKERDNFVNGRDKDKEALKRAAKK